MYDIAIIGAGVVGAMIARELMRYDVSLCVLERENDVACGATKANSAIVHAGFDAHPGSLKAKLNVRGSKLMKKVTDELGVKYINNGSLVIGFNDDDLLEIKKLLKQGIENGVEGVRILNSDELHNMEKNISEKATCALYAPTGAIVCPYELCIAAMGNAMDNGADLKLNFGVTDIQCEKGFYRILSDNNEVSARFVINAAGIYSDAIAKMAGDNSFNVHPRRGEYILLDRECGELTGCTIFRTPTEKGKGILVSPTVDGNYLAGPTAVDIDDKENKGTTDAGFERIKREATENLKNIPFGKTITSFCGLRAVGNTGDFIINLFGSGFINVAGIESPGLSASPAIAEYAVGLLKSAGAELKENKSFNPLRKSDFYFKNASDEEKNKIIEENPAFGKIVCRCESVTEGEIIEAIHRNPGARDVDGVKRRTRAGMGRCQGGFCLPYVMDILSRELDIPYESITKLGQGSEIAAGKTKEGAK